MSEQRIIHSRFLSAGDAMRAVLVACAMATVPGAATGSERLDLAQSTGEILVGEPANSGGARQATEEGTGDFAEPRPVSIPTPTYPRAARLARQEGQVLVCFTIDPSGATREAVVRASSGDVFNEPVLNAIRVARFLPARAGKSPVRSTACRTFRFVLR